MALKGTDDDVTTNDNAFSSTNDKGNMRVARIQLGNRFLNQLRLSKTKTTLSGT